MISATVPDWSREAVRSLEWNPGRRVLHALRVYQALRGKNDLKSRTLRARAIAEHRFWSVVAGAEVPLNLNVAGGLMIPHPNGVVLHPDVVLGPNCLLFQQVTIGVGSRPGLPVLGGHVDVGAGAKILGGVHIGDHVLIGANAVVLSDVPEGMTAVGIPAQVRPRVGR